VKTVTCYTIKLLFILTTFQKIRSLDTLTCSTCEKDFHIFDVYDLYYKEEPIVKESIDFLLRYASQPYRVEAKDEDSRELISNFLQEIKFAKIAQKMFSDLVKYGNAYLEIVRDDKRIVTLNPLEPRAVTIDLGKEVRAGIAYTGEREINAYVLKSGGGEKQFKPDDVLHFKQRVYPHYAPYGESVIRICLKDLHYLRTTREIALAKNQKWWIDYLEKNISLGIGVPPILLQKDYSKLNKTVLKWASTYVAYKIRWWQEGLSRPMQSLVFAPIVQSKGLQETPRLVWKQLQSTKIMADRGADFTDEIQLLKQLLDLEIISQQEYEEKISEYVP